MLGFSSHPRGLRTLFFTEMWERFSFYGMRGLLVLFLTSMIQKGGMGLDDKTATAIYGLYTASVYLASLPGGWVADRLIGARKAVFTGGLFIIAGQFLLAVPTSTSFFLGLLMIILGTGLLKPNISVMVGQLYPEGGVKQDSGFTIFYMGINVGAMLGSFLVGYLGENINWRFGFAASGIGMIIGLIQLKLTGHHLGNIGLRKPEEAPEKKNWYILWGSLGALVILVLLCCLGIIRINPLSLARNATLVIVGLALLFFINAFFFAGLTRDEKKRVGVIGLLFVASAMFFSGFEQAGSSLNIFAERYTIREVGFLANPVPASWFQSLNPIFIILFAPLVASLWPLLAKRNCNPPLIIKFAIGLILLALGFLVMAGGAQRVGEGNPVWPTWLISTYLIHTLGELCLSPVGLSTVSKLSPKRLVGQMMGIWFLASALGNLVAGLVAGHISTADEAEAAQPTAIVQQTESAPGQTAEAAEPTPGSLMSGQFMRIVWFSFAVAALLLIVSKPVRKITRQIE